VHREIQALNHIYSTPKPLNKILNIPNRRSPVFLSPLPILPPLTKYYVVDGKGYRNDALALHDAPALLSGNLQIATCNKTGVCGQEMPLSGWTVFMASPLAWQAPLRYATK
jgi:hypothetical protein